MEIIMFDFDMKSYAKRLAVAMPERFTFQDDYFGIDNSAGSPTWRINDECRQISAISGFSTIAGYWEFSC